MTEQELIALLNSPYTRCRDKVINFAQKYTKDTNNNTNIMFIQLNDIHTNGTSGRLSSFIECLKFATDAIQTLPIYFGISHGDLIDGLWSTRAANLVDAASFMAVYNTAPFLWLNSIGNHDDGSYINLYAQVLTKADQRSNFITPIDTKFPSASIQFGAETNACHYYFDDDTNKVRVIVLDPLDIPYVANGSALKYQGVTQFAFSDSQLNWLCNTALNLSAKSSISSWSTIVFCHVPIRNHTGMTPPAPGAYMYPDDIVPKILDAFKNGTTVSVTYTDTTYGGDFSYSVDQAFGTTNGGGSNFVGFFSGHRHLDLLMTDPTYTTQSNLVVNNAWTLRDTGETSKVNRLLNSDSQNSFDLVIIDRAARVVRSLRFGAGELTTDDPELIFTRKFTY